MMGVAALYHHTSVTAATRSAPLEPGAQTRVSEAGVELEDSIGGGFVGQMVFDLLPTSFYVQTVHR